MAGFQSQRVGCFVRKSTFCSASLPGKPFFSGQVNVEASGLARCQPEARLDRDDQVRHGEGMDRAVEQVLAGDVISCLRECV